MWAETADREGRLSFVVRRERLRRLGVEVVVAKHGSELPRREIAMSLPLDLSSVMRRDPESSFAPISDEEYAFVLEPASRTPEQAAAAGRYIEATGIQQSLASEPGTAPGSSRYYNSHAARRTDSAGCSGERWQDMPMPGAYPGPSNVIFQAATARREEHPSHAI